MSEPARVERARAAALFAELCDLPPSERGTRLAALAAADPALGAAVGDLLARDEAGDGPLERLRDDVAAVAERRLAEIGELGERGPSSTQATLETLGAWRLGARLGEGGMGEVWLGERVAGGFEQRAAVKLIRPGMASAPIIARFRAERQLLARLEHPAIARLLDGGVAPDGRPWFAMELVEGTPINRFAAERDLDLAARVRLVAAVADAVDFAHRALVVHRDLKPSNILVAADGAPKLLDFGLAKLLDPEGGEATRTGTELVALTPAYAAPEQVLGQPVTTAADVYALGVILFELATGRRPHRREARTGPGLVREVAAETLTRPSLAALAEGAEAMPPAFARRLKGDLDTVILKALAPDPERRYASAAELARDLRNWLASRPVSARPDTAAYRIRRFAQRNTVAVAAAALVALALVGGLAATAWQARRAARQAARAERVQAFLIDLFEGSDPDRSRGATITARELLDEGARQLESGLDEEPAAKAALLDAVAQIERRLGLVEASERHARAALALLDLPEGGAAALDRTRVQLTLAEALVERGDAAAARAELEPVRAALAAELDENAPELARADLALAAVLTAEGDRQGGLALAQGQLAREVRLHGEASAEAADARLVLGQFLELDDRFDSALAEYAASVAAFEATLGAGHARTEVARLALAELTAYRGDRERGEALFRQTIDGLVKTRGEGHLLVAEARLKLALVLINGARYAEADRELAAAFPIFEAVGHFDAAACLRTLGSSLFAQGRYAEAAARYAEARDRFRARMGEEHQLTQIAAANLGAAEVRMGELAAGEATLRAALAGLARATGEESDTLRQPLLALGEAERRQGRPEAALATHRRLLVLAEKLLGPEHIGAGNARREIALDLEAAGDNANLAEARGELDRAIAIRAATGGANHPRLAEWLLDSARLARAAGDGKRAAEDERRAAEIRRAQEGPR